LRKATTVVTFTTKPASRLPPKENPPPSTTDSRSKPHPVAAPNKDKFTEDAASESESDTEDSSDEAEEDEKAMGLVVVQHEIEQLRNTMKLSLGQVRSRYSKPTKGVVVPTYSVRVQRYGVTEWVSLLVHMGDAANGLVFMCPDSDNCYLPAHKDPYNNKQIISVCIRCSSAGDMQNKVKQLYAGYVDYPDVTAIEKDGAYLAPATVGTSSSVDTYVTAERHLARIEFHLKDPYRFPFWPIPFLFHHDRGLHDAIYQVYPGIIARQEKVYACTDLLSNEAIFTADSKLPAPEAAGPREGCTIC